MSLLQVAGLVVVCLKTGRVYQQKVRKLEGVERAGNRFYFELTLHGFLNFHGRGITVGG